MKSKYKRLIELIVIGFLLIIVLIFSIPHFLSNQKIADLKKIHQDLKLLIHSIQVYSINHPEIKNNITVSSIFYKIHDHERTRSYKQTFSGGAIQINPKTGKKVLVGANHTNITTNNYPLCHDFFKQNGYLNNSHKIQYFRSDSKEYTFFVIQTLKTEEQLKQENVDSVYAAYAFWPHFTKQHPLILDDDKVKYSQAFHDKTHPHPDGSFLKKQYYYSPTNGFDSFGFVYYDSLGNSSLSDPSSTVGLSKFNV